MAGHSKWKNIMHKKGRTDAQRAKVFTKIGKEITMAVKDGGGDPSTNAKLRDLIAKAKQNNVPNDNIDRVIKKAQGAQDGANYEAIVYEGYGKGGIGLIVETLTDNKNRTAADLRHYFDKFGAGLATPGAVSWQFEKKGMIVIEGDGVDEDALMMLVLDLGALDFKTLDNSFEIETTPSDYLTIREAVEKNGYAVAYSSVEMISQNYITLVDEAEIASVQKLFDALEDNDDVQNIYHNMENDLHAE